MKSIVVVAAWWRIPAVLVTRPFASACNSSPQDPVEEETDESRQADYFSYVCGGGAAARYDEVAIHRDDSQTRSSWSYVESGERQSETLEVDRGMSNEVFEALDNLDLASVDGMREVGNCSFSSETGLDGRVYRATWSESDHTVLRAISRLGAQLRDEGPPDSD